MRTEEEDVVSGETRTYGNPGHYTVSDFLLQMLTIFVGLSLHTVRSGVVM